MISRRRASAIVIVVAIATLAGGFLLKHPCTTHEWADYYQYRHYCYSDLLPLYYIRGMDRDIVPYVGYDPNLGPGRDPHFNEYPVLSGLFAYAAALLTDELGRYLLVSYLWLMIAGYLVTVALWRTGATFPKILAWSASPVLVVHQLTNWDLLAVALAAWGWLRWKEGRVFQAALWFGLGGAAKLYPAFFFPFLFLDLLKRKDTDGAGRLVTGGFLGFGVPNLAIALADFDGWLATWRFHARREPDFETPWTLLQAHGPDWLNEPGTLRMAAAVLTLVVVAVATLALGWRQWRVGRSPLVSGALITILFLLVNKVYSPQYSLWILPLLVVLGTPWTPLVGFALADVANFLVRYQYFIPPEGTTQGWNDEWKPWSQTLVVVRWAFLGWAALWMVGRHWRGQELEPARPKPPPSPEEAVQAAEPVDPSLPEGRRNKTA